MPRQKEEAAVLAGRPRGRRRRRNVGVAVNARPINPIASVGRGKRLHRFDAGDVGLDDLRIRRQSFHRRPHPWRRRGEQFFEHRIGDESDARRRGARFEKESS